MASFQIENIPEAEPLIDRWHIRGGEDKDCFVKKPTGFNRSNTKYARDKIKRSLSSSSEQDLDSDLDNAG